MGSPSSIVRKKIHPKLAEYAFLWAVELRFLEKKISSLSLMPPSPPHPLEIGHELFG